MTCTASAEVIRYMGADPICLDVEYGSSLLTPAILKEAIARHPEVKVLIVVHFGGQAAEMLNAGHEGVLALCRQNGIRVLEDAAHAFPASLNGQMVGSIGDRKSTRLNSSHVRISYAVFCLKKKKTSCQFN